MNLYKFRFKAINKEVGAVMEILEMTYKNLLYSIFNFSTLCYISTRSEIF